MVFLGTHRRVFGTAVTLLIAVTPLLIAMQFSAAATTAFPPLPSKWPTHNFAMGMADNPGDAATLHRVAPMHFRYQYLAGGVNTGLDWTTWNPNGTFVSRYDAESFAAHMTPVFSYYELLQSRPTGNDEATTDIAHLRSAVLMKTYWAHVRLFFERARSAHPVVLQVEPDLWGYLEQANDVALAHAFATTFVHLRDSIAPNVILGYHMSEWGTGHDVFVENPLPGVVRSYATKSAVFYKAIGVHFDVAFTDLSDRDAAYYENVQHKNTWFTAIDFANSLRYDTTFTHLANVRLVIWQIPLGNTLMRAENNTANHYQDNRVQWYLGPYWKSRLSAVAKSGVIALMFGRGTDGNTCACDAATDGITNPLPITGNVQPSISTDDDGGYFKRRVAVIMQAAPIPLPA